MTTSPIHALSALLLLFAGSIAGCSNNDLPRNDAKDLLLQSTKAVFGKGVIVDGSVPTEPYGYFWQENHSVLTTAEGGIDKALLTGTLQLDNTPLQVRFSDASSVFAKAEKVHRASVNFNYDIDITGITQDKEGSNARTVEFHWVQKSLPAIIKLIAYDRGEGVAHFQRYDDGWRVERVSIAVSKNKSELSGEELLEVENLKKRELLRLVAKETQRKKIFDETEKRYRESIKETEALISTKQKRLFNDELDLVTVSQTFVKVKNSAQGEVNIPFANIRSITDPRSAQQKENPASIKVEVFCSREYPHLNFNMKGAPALIVDVPKDRFDEVIRMANDALKKWRHVYGEFYGVDWQMAHYGKTCN